MDPEQLKAILAVMTEGKVFRLIKGDLTIEMSQYAYAPKLPEIPAFIPPPSPKEDGLDNYPPELRAPYQAFSDPMESLAHALGGMPVAANPQSPSNDVEQFPDPTDPNAPINDAELFGSNLPQPN